MLWCELRKSVFGSSVGLPGSRPAFPRRSVRVLLQSLKEQECHDERKRLDHEAAIKVAAFRAYHVAIEVADFVFSMDNDLLSTSGPTGVLDERQTCR
jgi:hypothetical protein